MILFFLFKCYTNSNFINQSITPYKEPNLSFGGTGAPLKTMRVLTHVSFLCQTRFQGSKDGVWTELYLLRILTYAILLLVL